MNKLMVSVVLGTCLLAGCGKEPEETPAPAAPQDELSVRMHDKEYLSKLDKQIAARKVIMRELADAKKALAAGEAAGKTGAELASLSNAVTAAIGKFEKNREESTAIVRHQINLGRADQAKSNNELKQ